MREGSLVKRSLLNTQASIQKGCGRRQVGKDLLLWLSAFVHAIS
jgi:hypothetical protein